jgi:cell division protein FtsB
MCKDCGCQSDHECSCSCDHGRNFERRYQTKAEQIAELEAYLKELKTEVQAVEEHLADLHK